MRKILVVFLLLVCTIFVPVFATLARAAQLQPTTVSLTRTGGLVGDVLEVVVKDVANGSTAPTGGVLIELDSRILHQVALSAGSVTVGVAHRGVPGRHVINVTYDGDLNFSGSSAEMTFDLGPYETESYVTFSSNLPVSTGVEGTIYVRIRHPTDQSLRPQGTVEIFLNEVLFQSVKVDSGSSVATVRFVPTAIGQYNFTTRFTPDNPAMFQPSEGSTTALVEKVPPVVNLSVLHSPASPGQEVELFGSVTIQNSSTIPPTGRVQFFIGEDLVGAADINVANGLANVRVIAPAVGVYEVKALYLGDENYDSVESMFTQVLEVAEGAGLLSTETSLLVSGTGAYVGMEIMITAFVDSALPPEGNVELLADGAVVDVVPVEDGVALFSFASETAGQIQFYARFVPTDPAKFTESEAESTISFWHESVVTLVADKSPSAKGEEVTFVATVTRTLNGPVPSGTIDFYVDSNLAGSVALVDGLAEVSTASLEAGEHSVSARYLGDEAYIGSQEINIKHVVESATAAVDHSKRLDAAQEVMTDVSATLATGHLMDGVAEEIGAALSGQVNVLSASNGKIGFVYTPGMGKGSIITPTADVATGENEIASWRIWTSLRYTDFDSKEMEGEQINALVGVSFLFGDGLVAGFVAGSENQDYADNVNAKLKGKGFNAGGYLGGALGTGFRFDAQAHASFLDYNLESGPVSGSTDATRLLVGGGFAHLLQFDALTIEPTARFSSTLEWQESYADSTAVLHDSRNFHFGRLAVGAKILHRFDLGGGASVSPFATGFADYRFSGGDTTQESLMDGMSARIGVGFDLRASNGITASALAEFSGLGLDNNVTVSSYRAQIAVPF